MKPISSKTYFIRRDSTFYRLIRILEPYLIGMAIGFSLAVVVWSHV